MFSLLSFACILWHRKGPACHHCRPKSSNISGTITVCRGTMLSASFGVSVECLPKFKQDVLVFPFLFQIGNLRHWWLGVGIGQ